MDDADFEGAGQGLINVSFFKLWWLPLIGSIVSIDEVSGCSPPATPLNITKSAYMVYRSNLKDAQHVRQTNYS